MLENAKKFVEEINELKTFIAKEGSDSIFSKNNTVEDIILCKKLFDLCDSTTDLLLEQARTMDDVNRKLDRLLEKSES